MRVVSFRCLYVSASPAAVILMLATAWPCAGWQSVAVMLSNVGNPPFIHILHLNAGIHIERIALHRMPPSVAGRPSGTHTDDCCVHVLAMQIVEVKENQKKYKFAGREVNLWLYVADGLGIKRVMSMSVVSTKPITEVCMLATAWSFHTCQSML